MKTRDDGVEQTAFLPAGVIGGSKADQDVVRCKLPDRVAERGQGVVGPDSPGGLDVYRLELTQHRVESLVGYGVSRIGVTREPLQAAWEGGRHDEDVGGSV